MTCTLQYKSAIRTVVERKSKYILILKLKSRKADEVVKILSKNYAKNYKNP